MKSRKFRLGVPREFFFALVSEDVRLLFDEAIRSLRRIGAATKEVSIPFLKDTEGAGNQIAWAEAAHYHRQSGWFPARAEEYGEDVRVRLEMGAKVLATAYLQALDLREKFIQQLRMAMENAGVDALAVPTTPIAAPLIGEETTRIGEKNRSTRALLLRLNRPANLAGVPAISIPCGFTSGGLPVGLQLIGAATDENLLLCIARTYETAHPWHRRRPEL